MYSQVSTGGVRKPASQYLSIITKSFLEKSVTDTICEKIKNFYHGEHRVTRRNT